jgi:serine protease Do
MRRNLQTIVALVIALAPAPSSYAQLPAAFDKRVPETVQELQAIEAHVQELVDKVMPATVGLHIGNIQGSGVIVDREGHILTAGHVSGAANREVTIIFPDGRRARGKTLGANSGIDSGMIILTEKTDFTHVEMAKSADAHKGQWCLALGHPGGYKPGRPPVVRLGRLQDVGARGLVSDCALVGGDSGGPLFDMNGRVIGIHSRIGDKVVSNIHVPIDTYRDTWKRLDLGEVWGNSRALLSAAPRPSDAYLGVRATADNQSLRIESVTPGSPAEKAGLKANDLIVQVDKQALSSPEELGSFLKLRRPGAQITVHVQRGSATMAIVVVLGKRAS